MRCDDDVVVKKEGDEKMNMICGMNGFRAEPVPM